jgi:hypothetical protein
MRYGNKTRLPAQVSDWLNGPTDNLLWPYVFEISSNVTVTADATPHTMGAWTEIIASTSDDAQIIIVRPSNSTNGTATQGFSDIAIGAAGSEQIIIDGVVSGAINQTSSQICNLIFPIAVPAGSRISARSQNVIASRSGTIQISLMKCDIAEIKSIQSLTKNPSTSRQFTLVGNDTWNEIVASTTLPYRALLFFPSTGTANTLAGSAILELGLGASGQEQSLSVLPALYIVTEYVTLSHNSFFPIYWPKTPIPTGSRISAKIDIAASSRDIAIWGVV